MMKYLLSQVWSEQNIEINAHLFKNTSDNHMINKYKIHSKT